MPLYLEIIACLSLIMGSLFLLAGSYGLVRMPDIFMRLHAPTKATTLGISGILITSMIDQTYYQGFLSIKELLITLFLFITAPVTANMIAKTALHQRSKVQDNTKGQTLINKIRKQEPPA